MEFFLAGIIMFGGNFAPRDWTFCEGQLLAISQFNAIFALLGTAYGGDGRSTFGIPDLRGRTPIGFMRGPGLPPYSLGQRTGTLQHTLSLNELASHTHAAIIESSGSGLDLEATINVSTTEGTLNDPTGAILALTSGNRTIYSKDTANTTTMAAEALTITGTGAGGSIVVGNTGNSVPFSLMQPSLAMNFIICMQGFFPPRN